MSVRSAVAIASSLFLLSPALAGQDIDGVGSFRETLSLESVGGTAISPDGNTVAYTVGSTDWEANRYDSEIWLVRDGGEPFQLTRTSEGSSTSPAWSPDGRWLAFTATREEGNQVHLISPRGGEAFAVTEVEDGVMGFEWSPDGDRMLLTIREPVSDEMEEREKLYGEWAFDDEPPRSAHLWVMEIESGGEAGEPRRLTEGDFHVADAAWSPDGTRIAYERRPDSAILSFTESDLHLVDVGTGESTPLVTEPGPDGGPLWSPDGQWILFSDFDRDLGSVFYLNGELARVPAGGGQPEMLTRDFDENPNAVAWNEAGIHVIAGDRTALRLYRLDPEARRMEEVQLPSHFVPAASFSADGSVLAFHGQGTHDLGEIYRVPYGTASVPEKLTDMTAQLDGWDVGTREVITWTSEDGAEIEGVLHKPSHYDPSRRYPLLVQIHGGPTGTSRPLVNSGYVYPVLQWLQKGAVVLQPNYRGSAGYGEAFRSLNVRNLGVGDMWDVVSGVEHLIEEGIADPDRLGSMGWSQGGYISAFLTTNTDIFQAISVGAGISNWMTYYVNTDIHPFTRQYLKGTPWDDPEIYARTSPITNILQASTPTLIQHGEFDARVPTPNAYELYQGLQDVGVETRLVIYAGFGHGITKPKERLAAVWHNWQWFGKHIWGEEIDLPLEENTESDSETETEGRSGTGG